MSGKTSSMGLWLLGITCVALGVLLYLERGKSIEAEGIVDSLPGDVADDSGFAEIFARELADPAFGGVAVAMAVLDERGEPWFTSPLAHTAMCPASALKILTTGAALGTLGADYRFETRLASAARIENGGLAGDLILVGGGDPTLTIARIDAMARQLVSGGLRRIDGRVLADASILPEHPMSDHWNWGDVGNAYGAGAYGLNVHRNRMQVGFRPGDSVGKPASLVGADVPLPGIEWNNLATTGAAGSGDRVVVYSEPYGRRVTFRGTVPAGVREFSVQAAIPDPPATATAALREALVKHGVEISGRERGSAVASVTLGASKSEPLREIIRSIHHTSDNVEAQCVFLALGAVGNESAAAFVRRYWKERGVTFAALRLLDGSGLARANMIRAVDLAAVMHAALAAPEGELFHESLPVYQEGMVRSKPGGMSGVSTGVGTIACADGRRVTYAFMANGAPDTRAARDLRGRLRAAVARVGVAE